jgi:pimeloyl-ACP methyl ester carboxylesterase
MLHAAAWPVAVALLFAAACSKPPPFQGLVTVDGRRLYLECAGSGTPAVVLEADFQRGVSDWPAVQGQVAAFSLVCSYDRLGHGRSDRTTEPSAGEQAVDDLRVVLASANVPAPYVLVGNGFGGLLVQLFAQRYPRDVAAIVLIDADDDSLAARFQAAGPAAVRESYRRWMREDPDGRAVAATYAAARAASLPPGVPLVRLTHGLAPTERSAALEIPRDEPDLVVQAIRALVRRPRVGVAVRGRTSTARAVDGCVS